MKHQDTNNKAVSDTARKRPGLFKIVATDYAAMLGCIMPLVGIGLWILSRFGVIGKGSSTFMWIGLVSTVLGVFLLMKRVQYFSRLFSTGREVKGTVISIWFHEDRGRVDYSYDFDGKKFIGGNAVHKTPRTKMMKEGMDITILVDPAKPQSSLPLDLYN